MAVACIILVVIAVLGIGLAFYYRRQIKNVKNQISFLNQHETNMLITSDQKSGCVAELTDELNRVINRQRVGRTPEWFYNGKCDK